MTIASLDNYIASARQAVPWYRATSRTSVALMPFSMFDVAGINAGGTLAIGNTANGLVPTDATQGYPILNAFGGGATGYISRLEGFNSVASRILLFDRLFACGAYAFNASTTLASQPSFSGRVPGSDYSGLEIWLEQVTAGTGNQNVAVTYTDQSGNTGATTGTVATAVNIVGRCWKLPLAAGDSGVQKIESVVGSTASVGTFNIMVLRPLASIRVAAGSWGDQLDMLRTGLPEIYADSALYALVQADSTATGTPELRIEVANA